MNLDEIDRKLKTARMNRMAAQVEAESRKLPSVAVKRRQRNDYDEW